MNKTKSLITLSLGSFSLAYKPYFSRVKQLWKCKNSKYKPQTIQENADIYIINSSILPWNFFGFIKYGEGERDMLLILVLSNSLFPNADMSLWKNYYLNFFTSFIWNNVFEKSWSYYFECYYFPSDSWILYFWHSKTSWQTQISPKRKCFLTLSHNIHMKSCFSVIEISNNIVL